MKLFFSFRFSIKYCILWLFFRLFAIVSVLLNMIIIMILCKCFNYSKQHITIFTMEFPTATTKQNKRATTFLSYRFVFNRSFCHCYSVWFSRQNKTKTKLDLNHALLTNNWALFAFYAKLSINWHQRHIHTLRIKKKHIQQQKNLEIRFNFKFQF